MALRVRNPRTHVDIFRDLDRLREFAAGAPPHIIVVNSTLPVALGTIHAFHVCFPELPLLALGLHAREAEVVAHGSAGFACFLDREEGLDAQSRTCKAMPCATTFGLRGASDAGDGGSGKQTWKA